MAPRKRAFQSRDVERQNANAHSVALINQLLALPSPVSDSSSKRPPNESSSDQENAKRARPHQSVKEEPVRRTAPDSHSGTGTADDTLTTQCCPCHAGSKAVSQEALRAKVLDETLSVLSKEHSKVQQELADLREEKAELAKTLEREQAPRKLEELRVVMKEKEASKADKIALRRMQLQSERNSAQAELRSKLESCAKAADEDVKNLRKAAELERLEDEKELRRLEQLCGQQSSE